MPGPLLLAKAWLAQQLVPAALPLLRGQDSRVPGLALELEPERPRGPMSSSRIQPQRMVASAPRPLAAPAGRDQSWSHARPSLHPPGPWSAHVLP